MVCPGSGAQISVDPAQRNAYVVPTVKSVATLRPAVVHQLPEGSTQLSDHRALALRVRLSDARRDPLSWWLAFYVLLGVLA